MSLLLSKLSLFQRHNIYNGCPIVMHLQHQTYSRHLIFLNDDVTTMDFVVKTLIMVFKKDKMTAVGLMLEVHHNGAAVVDVLPLEQAELRQQQTHSMAQKEGYPLRCLIEPV